MVPLKSKNSSMGQALRGVIEGFNDAMLAFFRSG